MAKKRDGYSTGELFGSSTSLDIKDMFRDTDVVRKKKEDDD